MSGKETSLPPSPFFGVTSKQNQQAFSSSSRSKRRIGLLLLSGGGGGGTRRHTPPPLPWAWMEDGKKASLFSSSSFPAMCTVGLALSLSLSPLLPWGHKNENRGKGRGKKTPLFPSYRRVSRAPDRPFLEMGQSPEGRRIK